MPESLSGNNNPHTELAKAAIRAYVERGEVAAINADGSISVNGESGAGGNIDYSPLLNDRAGVFVSIKKTGALRGCIGTISPIRDNLAEEIVDNAISACSRDPRFEPVTPDELCDLSISVDVLSEAEPIESIHELDVIRYGVIVSKGRRRGLLLPNLEGVDTVEEQVRIALSKAGIHPSERYSMERFKVVRHEPGGSKGV